MNQYKCVLLQSKCNVETTMNWEKLITNKRLGQEDRHPERHEDRSEFKRDYDRLIFSAPFRRIPYLDALETYGTDKPDLRIDLTAADAKRILESQPVDDARSAGTPFFASDEEREAFLSRHAKPALLPAYQRMTPSTVYAC